MGIMRSSSTPAVVLPNYKLDSNLVLLPGIIYNVSFSRFKAATLLSRYYTKVPDMPLVKSLLNEYDFDEESLSKNASSHPGLMSKEAYTGIKKYNGLFPESVQSDFDNYILAISPNLDKIVEPDHVKGIDIDAKQSVVTIVRIVGISDDSTTIKLTFQALSRGSVIPGFKGKDNEVKVHVNLDDKVTSLKQEFSSLSSLAADLFGAIDDFIVAYRQALALTTSIAKKTKNGSVSNGKLEDPKEKGDLLTLNPLANALYLQLAGSKDFIKAYSSLQSIYASFESEPKTLDAASFLRLIDLTTAIIPFPSFQKLALLSKQDPSLRIDEISSMMSNLIELFDSIKENNNVMNHWFYKEASRVSKANIVASQLKSIRLILEGMAKNGKTQSSSNNSQSRSLIRRRGGNITNNRGSSTPTDEDEDGGDEDDDLRIINEFIKNQLPHINSMSSDTKRLILKDYKRIKSSPPGNSDFHVIRNYLEIVADLPWDKYITNYKSNKDINIEVARAQLDKDHYGLEHVKKRLIQYLVVLKLLGRNAEMEIDKKIKEEQKDNKGNSGNVNNSDNQSYASKMGKFKESIVIDNSDETSIAKNEATIQNEKSRKEARDASSLPSSASLIVSKNGKAPIILLAGPPGTGKTSLARSIAQSLGRKFQRVALGGVRDEAEIRGHRRTYVGAMPGVIIQALRKARSMNPVILLDEIDKVIGGSDGAMKAHGDPAAALLEVLDPEQNVTFNDHYLGFPVDLSQVIFVCTANEPYNLSKPLLDRLEMIEVGAYDYNEKAIIGEKYLLPRQIKRNGLPDSSLVKISSEVMEKIIVDYTREAGVRNFERKLGTICRNKAVEYAAALESPDSTYDPVVQMSSLPRYLGIPFSPFSKELQEPFQSNKFGVVNGLSYNTDGSGSVLVFESIGFHSDKFSLNMTGRLGEVLMESAKIGATFIKSILQRNLLNFHDISENYLDKLSNTEIHLHVPAGAIQKDGPSAGITMALSFLSLIIEKPVPCDIAMTGEITLRGSVLPIGGVKEKLLGAHFSGIKKVILPRENRKDIIKEYCYGINDDSKLNDLLIDNDSKNGYQLHEPEQYIERKLGIKLFYANEFWDVIKAVWGDELLEKIDQARLVEYHL